MPAVTACEAAELVERVFHGSTVQDVEAATAGVVAILEAEGVPRRVIVLRSVDPFSGGPGVVVKMAGRTLLAGADDLGRWLVRCGGSSWSGVSAERLGEAVRWHLGILRGEA